MPNRKGFALLVAVVFVAVVAIMATVITVNLTGDNDAQRVSKAADILHRFVAEIDSVAPAFRTQVARLPGKLSQLDHKITTADRNSCNATFTGAQVSAWRGPYHLIPIPTTGYQAAPGFMLNDLLVRTPATGSQNSAGVLAIVMSSVSIADARSLSIVVNGNNLGTGPIVTFTASGENPVEVKYNFNIVGC